MQQPPQYYVQPQSPGLGVGDGFKFGCGFFIAGAIALTIFYIIAFLIVVLMGGVAGGILQQLLREVSFVLPALALL